MSTNPLHSLSIDFDAWTGLLPEGIEDVPFEDELKYVFKDVACYQMDGALRAVSRARAVLEKHLGSWMEIQGESIPVDMTLLQLMRSRPDILSLETLNQMDRELSAL